MLTSIFVFLSFILSVLGGHKPTLQQAEDIMGEPCKVSSQNSTAENGGHKFECVFVPAKSETPAANNLYYTYKSYGTEHEAKNIYEGFVNSNRDNSGFELLDEMGEGAFVKTDHANFYLIIAHKKNEIVSMKVSKINAKVSLAALKKVCKEIIDRS
jgi:hypothetical protein